MRSEDDAERLLRVIREQKKALTDRVVSGVQPDGSGGYWYLVGSIGSLDWVETVIIETLRGDFPEEMKRRPADRYDV